MTVGLRIQKRRDTAANWASNNPVLNSGEAGLETDTGYEKVGNGATAWNSLAYSVTSPVVAKTAATSSRGKVLSSPAGVGQRDIWSLADDPWLVVPDAVATPFTTAVGSTLSYAAAQTSDIGKTVCIPGAGASDGFGVNDGFTTTITAVSPGVSATLNNAVVTNVTTGSTRVCRIGTDWITQIMAFITALGVAGAKGIAPAGNYLHTGTISFGSALLSHVGVNFHGAGAGANNTTATSATSFWYAGPANSTVNGAGAPAMSAANAGGIYGLKQSGFGILCLRALAVSTTVNGAGQTISTSPINLAVASTAGLPTTGRVTIVGGIELYYTGISGNSLTGAQTAGGTYTTVGGEVVRQVVAGFYWDNLAQSDASDIIVAGYTDNNGSNTNANQGRGVWLNNFSSGFSTATRVHARYFDGGEDSWRFGTANAGTGVRGNGGNCTVTACTTFTDVNGFYFQGVNGPVDGNTFNSLKAVGSVGGGYGIKVDAGYSGNTWNSPHTEGFTTGIQCAGVGNVFNAPFASYEVGSLGDGSAAVHFTGNASGNSVVSGTYVGWTGGSSGAPSGTPGFDYGCVFDGTTSGNRVFQRTITGFLVPGTAPANYTTTLKNVYLDLANVPLPEAEGNAQAGLIVPSTRLPRSPLHIALIANQAWVQRFTVSRPVNMVELTFLVVTGATGGGDSIDVGIYSSVAGGGGNLTKVVSSGSTAGHSGAGKQTIPLATLLLPGIVYYAALACGTLGGSAAALAGLDFLDPGVTTLFGIVAGLAEIGIAATSFPLPSTLSPTWGGVSSGLVMALRES